jgi:hypothetical protein
MSIAKKYDIPEDKIKLLIKDGWISCTASNHEYVYKIYHEFRSKGVSKTQAISNAAEAGRVSERFVYEIIHKFE